MPAPARRLHIIAPPLPIVKHYFHFFITLFLDVLDCFFSVFYNDFGGTNTLVHTVLIYGVNYNTNDPAGTAIYTTHMGWHSDTSAYASSQINACWFYECAYIDCGTNGHAQGLIWNNVDATYHDITCHCGIYLKERHIAYIDPATGYCTKCGRKFNVVPEINSATTEELN